MEELKVPTRLIAVEVCTTDGAIACGSMYHTESLYQTGSPEDIIDELNDDRAFVPFAASDTLGNALLSKRHIVRVRVSELAIDNMRPGEASELQHVHPCTLQFDDGTRITGRLVLETPISQSRLVDKVNQGLSFVPFVSDEGVDLVNCTHIARILVDD